MVAYQFIELEIADNLATITLNRPDKLNSFNSAMAREFLDALKSFAPDGKNHGAVRTVIVTGSGRAFCAGQDLAEAAPADEPWPDLRMFVKNGYNPIIKTIRSLEIPIIAAVNGIAAGAGANLALACDFVVAKKSSFFLQAFCHIGFIPDSGGTYFLPRLVGLARATQLMMLGEKISAQQAYDWGLIYQVVPDDVFTETYKALGTRLSQMPTKGLGLIKRAINQSLHNDLEKQLLLEEELQSLAGSTQDYREGVMAFLEKRKPKFIGK